MISTTTQTPTLFPSATLWSPARPQSTRPQLIAHWEKDDRGKLYCRWVKV